MTRREILRSQFETIPDPVVKLRTLHESLKLNGKFNEEYPEQLMTMRYLKGNEKVLEIGGNIGRNSLVIGTLLDDESNLVVLECDDNIARQLIDTRNCNGYQFRVEKSALSKRKLIQKGWDTIPSDVLLDGYKQVNNISFSELESKYNIKFDTLVADCEGALYYIFDDFPDMLNNIEMVIMENDYHDHSKKVSVDTFLKNKGLIRIYSEAGGWGPCYGYFYEVWKKGKNIPVPNHISATYGTDEVNINVTSKLLSHLTFGKISVTDPTGISDFGEKIYIPKNIYLNDIFGDPIYGKVKRLKIKIGNEEYIIPENREIDHTFSIQEDVISPEKDVVMITSVINTDDIFFIANFDF
jgi:hypothetical protein